MARRSIEYVFYLWNSDLRGTEEQPGTIGWRREWDSNPRDPYEPTRVPGVRLQPLGHLSVAPHLGGAHYTQRRLKHNVCLEANVALDLGCEGPAMKPRLCDNRVGYFSITVTDYPAVQRWRTTSAATSRAIASRRRIRARRSRSR